MESIGCNLKCDQSRYFMSFILNIPTLFPGIHIEEYLKGFYPSKHSLSTIAVHSVHIALLRISIFT